MDKLVKELKTFFLFLTTNEKLSLDETHPFYEDREFLDKLIEFYELKEEYEKCGPVVEIINSII